MVSELEEHCKPGPVFHTNKQFQHSTAAPTRSYIDDWKQPTARYRQLKVKIQYCQWQFNIYGYKKVHFQTFSDRVSELSSRNLFSLDTLYLQRKGITIQLNVNILLRFTVIFFCNDEVPSTCCSVTVYNYFVMRDQADTSTSVFE